MGGVRPILPDLPVRAALSSLSEALRCSGCCILCAAPGSGKTTLAPLFLSQADWLEGKKILLLEPRRIAARAAAARISELAGCELGTFAGYQVRLEKCYGPDSSIIVLTEGLLTRKMLSDPFLSDVGLVIFDEFHERGLNADMGLALALDIRRGLRPDLRLLVVSATLDTGNVAARLGKEVPVIEAEGTVHPVRTVFAPCSPRFGLPENAACVCMRALAENGGTVLAFLPGEGEIRKTAAALEKAGCTAEVLPLYASLPAAEQRMAMRPPPDGARRIVLSTSVAESSVTIEGVKSVVDCGYSRVSVFSQSTGMSRLETVRVTRDRADQRRGRAGRLGPGVCYRMWPEAEDSRLSPYAQAEILSADLSAVVLQCAEWGVTSPDGLPWIDQPPKAAWNRAVELLRFLGAVDGSGGITGHGREMLAFGAHPRMAHAILCAGASGSSSALRFACVAAAILSECRRPACTDIEAIADAVEKGGDEVSPGERSRILELAKSWQSAYRAAKPRHGMHSATGESGEVPPGVIMAWAYPDRIGIRRRTSGEYGRYMLRCGRGAKTTEPGNGLSRSEWIVACDVDDRDADGTVRLGAALSRADAEKFFGGEFEKERIVEWNSRQGRVDAVVRVRLGRAVVSENPWENAPPDSIAECLCLGVSTAGVGALGWPEKAAMLRMRVMFLRRTMPGCTLPDMSDEALERSPSDWLGPYVHGLRRLSDIDGAVLLRAVRGYLGSGAATLDQLAPESVIVPSGSHVRIDYSGETPTASVRIQEVYGLCSTPLLADGRVPLTFCLLSPAGRPLQTTSDIAGFWKSSYAIVRKEMRGRYPKHFWPEDPSSAPATRRVRPQQTA